MSRVGKKPVSIPDKTKITYVNRSLTVEGEKGKLSGKHPATHPVPVTPEQMAAQAREAFDAGASVMHVHFRRQEDGMGHLPTWDADIAAMRDHGAI